MIVFPLDGPLQSKGIVKVKFHRNQKKMILLFTLGNFVNRINAYGQQCERYLL